MSGSGPFRIRDLSGQRDFELCVRLQEAVWGDGFAERVPTAILGIAARYGGVVAGAFREGEEELAGFVFGLTGLEDGTPVHWSDMLAVRKDSRGRGLARTLKLHQRRKLLELGVTRMYWSFDPLEARNGHLNLNRLGVRVGEYVEEMYGSSSSPLHQGIGTDRFVARWDLDSPRVQALVESEEGAGYGAEVGGDGSARGHGDPGSGAVEVLGPDVIGNGAPTPGAPRLHLEGARLLVAVPARIQELKARDPELALAWRQATREVLSHYLARGWEVRSLLAKGEAPCPRYLLVREG